MRRASLPKPTDRNTGLRPLLRRLWHIILPPKCHCRIERERSYIRSTIRECPVHGDDVLRRKYGQYYGRL